MYERKSDALLPRLQFLFRIARHAAFALLFTTVSLLIGILGYHGLERLSYLDSLLNASMILGGMGPVTELHTAAGKLFASCYALFSGMIFLIIAGVLFAPAFHRALHKFHLEAEDDDEPKARAAVGRRGTPAARPRRRSPRGGR